MRKTDSNILTGEMSQAEREIKNAGVSVTERCVGGIESLIDTFVLILLFFFYTFLDVEKKMKHLPKVDTW